VVALWAEEMVRDLTNQRARVNARSRRPGPESSIGKVHQGELNQRTQVMAADVLGAYATAWVPGDPGWAAGGAGPEEYAGVLPHEVKGMLRSLANTIEGGTTEVNKNIVGERVLGLPREPDPLNDAPWCDVPRS
jgi:alkylation response protein AidB-like acyl-CoA dehydrogenase